MRRPISILRRFFVPRRRRPKPEGGKGTSGQGADHALSSDQRRRLEHAIGYAVHDPVLFAQALVHRSYLQRLPSSAHSNERLEFLGDSILNFVVAEHLYHRYPEAEEGELTKVRARLVNRKALAAYARTLHLSEFILMSPSAAQSLDKGADAIVSDTFEALIAAIYLDGGFSKARDFVLRQVTGALRVGTIADTDQNYKSRLLEYAQSHGLGSPRYVIVKEEGPDHDRTFTVEVQLSGVRRGTGTGKNKKEAEQGAASQALGVLSSSQDA
ncbi:MAG TPA: ribonuclease III [Bacteroidota bacterium]